MPALRADGHEVIRLVRRTPRTADEHRWDPQHRRIDETVLADVDAVINLAGEPIRPRPWTRSYKQRLLDSRVDSTATISEAVAAAAMADPSRTRVLLSGSAVGSHQPRQSRSASIAAGGSLSPHSRPGSRVTVRVVALAGCSARSGAPGASLPRRTRSA